MKPQWQKTIKIKETKIQSLYPRLPHVFTIGLECSKVNCACRRHQNNSSQSSRKQSLQSFLLQWIYLHKPTLYTFLKVCIAVNLARFRSLADSIMRVFTTSIGVVANAAIPEEQNPTPMVSHRERSSMLFTLWRSEDIKSYLELHVERSESFIQCHLLFTEGRRCLLQLHRMGCFCTANQRTQHKTQGDLQTTFKWKHEEKRGKWIWSHILC